jgi:hypothetical protein
MSDEKENKITPEFAEQFLKVQQEEIQVRKQELELRKQENENSHQYALASLDAQKEIYQKTPSERRTDWWNKAGIALIFLVVVLIAIGGLFYINKDDLAAELIKAFVITLLAGGAGYGIGFNRGRKYQKQEHEDG